MTWFDSLQVNSVYLLSCEDNDPHTNVSHAELPPPTAPAGGTGVLIIKLTLPAGAEKGQQSVLLLNFPAVFQGMKWDSLLLLPYAAQVQTLNTLSVF